MNASELYARRKKRFLVAHLDGRKYAQYKKQRLALICVRFNMGAQSWRFPSWTNLISKQTLYRA